MKKAGDFLSRFQKLTPPNDALRSAVVRAVSAVAGITLRKQQVVIRNGVVHLEGQSVVKHTIRLVRHEILAHIHERIPASRNSIRDIR